MRYYDMCNSRRYESRFGLFGSFFNYLDNMFSYIIKKSFKRSGIEDEDKELLNVVDNFIEMSNNPIQRIKTYEQMLYENNVNLFEDYMDYVKILTTENEVSVRFKKFKEYISTELDKFSKKIDELLNTEQFTLTDKLWISKFSGVFSYDEKEFSRIFLGMLNGNEEISKLKLSLLHTLCEIWNAEKKYFDTYYKEKKEELDGLYDKKSGVSKHLGDYGIFFHLLLKPEVKEFFDIYGQIDDFLYQSGGFNFIKDTLMALKPKFKRLLKKIENRKLDNVMEKIYGLTHVKDNVFIQYLPQGYPYRAISSECFLEFDFRYEYDNFNPDNSRTIFTLFFNTCESVNHKGFVAETEWYKYSNVRRYRVGEFSCQGIQSPNSAIKISTSIKTLEKAQDIIECLRGSLLVGLNMMKSNIRRLNELAGRTNEYEKLSIIEKKINFLRAKRIKDIVWEANRIPNLSGNQYENFKIINHPVDNQQDNRIFEKGFVVNESDVMYFEDFNDDNGEEKFRLTNKLQLTEPTKNANTIFNMLCYNNTWKERWEAIKNPQDQEHNSIFDFREVFQSMPEEDQKGRVFSPNIPRVQDSIERDEELENTIIKRMETLEIIKNVQAYIKAEGRLIVTSKNMEKGSQYVTKDNKIIEETSITGENEQDANEQNAQIVGALNEVNQNIQPNQKFYK